LVKGKFMKTALGKAAAALLLAPLATTANAADLTGNWSCRGTDGPHTLLFQGDSTLVFDGETYNFALMPGAILVQEEQGIASYGYQLTGANLQIGLADGSMLTCRRGGSAPQAVQPPHPPSRQARPGDVDSATLQREIAGTWWGYSGSTERRIGLCPDGSYRDFTESGYSGRSYDAGGAESMAWGSASQSGNQGRWQIRGNYQNGVIQVQTHAGRQFTLSYRQVGEPGCLDINGARLCRTSRQCE
jgi:hypothetical protein